MPGSETTFLSAVARSENFLEFPENSYRLADSYALYYEHERLARTLKTKGQLSAITIEQICSR